MSSSKKTWHGTSFFPEAWTDSFIQESATLQAPASLELARVIGYRARDVRNNIRFLSDPDEFCFFAAAVGVVQNLKTGAQRFYREHDDDIICLDYHSESNLVATGQTGKEPYVAIWDPSTLETVSTIRSEAFDGPIFSVSFSPDGEFLVLMVGRKNHIFLYRMEEGRKPVPVAELRGPAGKIYACRFGTLSPRRIYLMGSKYFGYVDVIDDGGKSGASLTSLSKGIFGKFKMSSVTCCVEVQSTRNGVISITGTSDGTIIYWKGKKALRSHKICSAGSPVIDMDITPGDKPSIAACTLNGSVVFVSNVLVRQPSVVELTPCNGNLRSVCFIPGGGGTVLVGSGAGRIFQISDEGEVADHMYCHSSMKLQELWGLDVSRKTPGVFFTAGDDGYVFCWDLSALDAETPMLPVTQKKYKNIKFRSVGCSTTGDDLVAIGTHEGKVAVFDAKKMRNIKMLSASTKNISSVKFSPDDSLLAAGSHDGVISVYTVSHQKTGWRKKALCLGNSSYVISLDWSCGGDKIRSDSGDRSLLFFNFENSGKMLTRREDIQGIPFYTSTLRFTRETEGVFERGMDGTDVNTVDVHFDYDVCESGYAERGTLAYGTDFGELGISSFPLVSSKQPRDKYSGHSSHVSCVRWTPDGKYLISVGGLDGTVLIWRVRQKGG